MEFVSFVFSLFPWVCICFLIWQQYKINEYIIKMQKFQTQFNEEVYKILNEMSEYCMIEKKKDFKKKFDDYMGKIENPYHINEK